MPKYIQYDDHHFYWNKDSIDFDRLLNVLDSIKTTPQAVLKEIFLRDPDFWSTNGQSTTITLKNHDGKIIEIGYYASRPNAFCLPWEITVNGLKTRSLSPEIIRLVEMVCPSLILEANKVPVLHQVVKAMY